MAVTDELIVTVSTLVPENFWPDILGFRVCRSLNILWPKINGTIFETITLIQAVDVAAETR